LRPGMGSGPNRSAVRISGYSAADSGLDAAVEYQVPLGSGYTEKVCHGASPAFAVVRKHLHRHGVFEAPDHADRPLALVTDQVRRAEAGERQEYSFAFFSGSSCRFIWS
jgi:hypothetical protein